MTSTVTRLEEENKGFESTVEQLKKENEDIYLSNQKLVSKIEVNKLKM